MDETERERILAEAFAHIDPAKLDAEREELAERQVHSALGGRIDRAAEDARARREMEKHRPSRPESGPSVATVARTVAEQVADREREVMLEIFGEAIAELRVEMKALRTALDIYKTKMRKLERAALPPDNRDKSNITGLRYKRHDAA